MNYSEKEKEESLDFIKKELIEFRNLSFELRSDKDFVLKVLEIKKITKYIIQDISKELKDDKDIALAAVKKDGIALEELSKRLRSDKDVVLEAVRKNAYSLSFAANELRDCDEVVIQAFKSYLHSFKFASERLKNNKDLVLKLVGDEGIVLRHASEELQNDKNVLECLEKKDVSNWHISEYNWYQERMEILANIRRLEEKKLMDKSIISSDKISKKLKF